MRHLMMQPKKRRRTMQAVQTNSRRDKQNIKEVMKSFLLCIAIGLAFFSTQAAYAQDTTYHPLPDSLSADTAKIDTTVQLAHQPDSLRQVTAKAADSLKAAGHLRHGKDSIPGGHSPLKDTTHQEAAMKDAARQKKDSTDTTDTSHHKIVDIFAEMAAARDQQEQSIEQEAARKQADKKARELATKKASERLLAADRQIKTAIEKAQQAAGQTYVAAADSTKRQQDTPSDSRVQPDSTSRLSGEALAAADLSAENPGRSPGQKLADDSAAGLLPPASDTAAGHSDTTQNIQDTIESIFILQKPKSPLKKDTDALSDQASPITDSAVSMRQSETTTKDSLNQRLAANSGDSDLDKDKDTSLIAKAPIQTPRDSAAYPTGQSTAQADSSSQDKAPLASSQEQIDERPDSVAADSSRPQVVDQTAMDTLAAKNTPFTALFQPYRIFNKQTKISSITSLKILQQNVDYKTTADFTTQYQRTGQRHGGFLFDVSVVKLNTAVETMGVQLKYDSNGETDSTSTFAKPLFDIVGKRTFIQVDSTGKITAIDSSRLGRQVNTVLSGLSLSGGDFEVGSNFGLLVSHTGPMEVGQAWTDSVSHGGNKTVTTYKVQSILDGNLLVTITGAVSQTGVITSDGAIFKTHFTGTQKGKMYIDQQTLLVKSRTIQLTMQGTVDYNGQPLPASATSKIEEQVTHE